MTINNGVAGVPLTGLAVDVNFADQNGSPVRATSDPNDLSARFFIRLQTGSSIPASIAGGARSTIAWLIIPAQGAAGQNPQGQPYSVGATLTYIAGGQSNSVAVVPDTIFVKPLPNLTLDYFLPDQVYGDDPSTPFVEPVVPFNLGVRVKNTGFGTARSLKIESAQPRIIDNKQGLLVDFHIQGSEVNGQPATASLLANFGDIEANRSGVARWIMTCTLSGRFLDFTANYTHSDELGGQLTSLISGQPRTHLLVHDVLVDLPGRDGVRDFLAKDNDVLRVYESENTDTVVADLSGNSAITSAGSGRYVVNTIPSSGFIQIKLTDPLGGQQLIRAASRADGKIINAANVWLSQTRDSAAQRWNYFVNIFDVNNKAGQPYTLNFVPSGPATNRPPKLDAINNWAINVGNFLSFPITAFDPDANRLTFSFDSVPSIVTNATLDAATGLFRWRPNRFQAPTTNVFQVRVTDNGSPPMSDTAQFTVVVLPSDRFLVSLGRTNVFAGESNAVPLMLKSDVDLTNVTFVFAVPEAKLTNFSLNSIAPEVFAYGMVPLGSNHYAVNLTVDPLRVQFSTRTLAMLGFQSQIIQTSTIVPITLEDVEGRRGVGTTVTNALTAGGQVIVFASQPVLIADATPTRSLTLYGRPGASYAIESKGSLATNTSWSDLVWIPLSNRWQNINLDSTQIAAFFRTREFQADPPAFRFQSADVSSASLVVYGKPGSDYTLESASSLSHPSWAPIDVFGLSNSWRMVGVTNSGSPGRFFRLLKY